MASLSDHASSRFAKLLYIGDSGSGKTGSLEPLLRDGYHMRIIDMDNGLDSLVQFAKKNCPAALGNVEYETLRDAYTSTRSGPIVKSAKAFVAALEKMTEWAKIEDDNTIFVLDSLSAFGKAAFEWAKGLNPTAKDPRQWYFAAQQAVENTLALLTSEDFKMNVIVISHVNYKEVTEGVHKGYANAIGAALGPIIPRYFNTMLLAESQGSGTNTKRKIKTMPTGIIDVKNPAPSLPAVLDLETGLSAVFKALKGQN